MIGVLVKFDILLKVLHSQLLVHLLEVCLVCFFMLQTRRLFNQILYIFLSQLYSCETLIDSAVIS